MAMFLDTLSPVKIYMDSKFLPMTGTELLFKIYYAIDWNDCDYTGLMQTFGTVTSEIVLNRLIWNIPSPV